MDLARLSKGVGIPEPVDVTPGGQCKKLEQNVFFCKQVRGSIVVSISACHAEDPGSIPGRGERAEIHGVLHEDCSLSGWEGQQDARRRLYFQPFFSLGVSDFWFRRVHSTVGGGGGERTLPPRGAVAGWRAPQTFSKILFCKAPHTHTTTTTTTNTFSKQERATILRCWRVAPCAQQRALPCILSQDPPHTHASAQARANSKLGS